MEYKLAPWLVGGFCGVFYFLIFFITDNPWRGEQAGWGMAFAHFPVIVIWAPLWRLANLILNLPGDRYFLTSLIIADFIAGALIAALFAQIWRKFLKRS